MQQQIFSSEGGDILPVKPNDGPHQYFCSPLGSSPVKTKRTRISRLARMAIVALAGSQRRLSLGPAVANH